MRLPYPTAHLFRDCSTAQMRSRIQQRSRSEHTRVFASVLHLLRAEASRMRGGHIAVQMSLCTAAAACKVTIACDPPNDQPGGTGAVCAPYKQQRYRLAGCLRMCSTGLAPSLSCVTRKYPQSGAGPGGTDAGYGCWTGCCRPAGCRRAARACACPPASAASPSRRPCSCSPYPTLPRVRKKASSAK